MTDSLDFRGRVVRDENSEIKLHSGKYWGINVVDIRWYNNDKPTRKGIRLNIQEAKLVKELLEKILEDEL